MCLKKHFAVAAWEERFSAGSDVDGRKLSGGAVHRKFCWRKSRFRKGRFSQGAVVRYKAAWRECRLERGSESALFVVGDGRRGAVSLNVVLAGTRVGKGYLAWTPWAVHSCGKSRSFLTSCGDATDDIALQGSGVQSVHRYLIVAQEQD